MSEPNSPTTISDLDITIQHRAASESIFANAELLVWDNAADIREPTGGAKGVEFPVYSAIAVQTTPLSASANPDPVALADSSKTITCNEYGMQAQLQKRVTRQRLANTADDTLRLTAVNMAETVDALAGAVAVGGSTVAFVDSVANAAALEADDVLDRAEILKARAQLGAAKAPRFADGTYHAFITSANMADLFSPGTLGEFVDVAKYADPEALRTGEIGRFHGFTFFEATQGIQVADGVEAGVDSYKMMFIGAGYLGKAVAMEPMVNAMRDLNDAMNRFMVVSWYGDFAYGRVNESNAYRLEGRSAFQ